jgi:predicted porin
MNKKSAVALAVGALFAAPAVAQTGEVQIYGRVYPAFASFKASGATAAGAAPSNLVNQPTAANPDFKQRYSVDSYNTRLGFRGREALGGGMNAIWQIEQRVRIDDGAAGLWASRNSFVGLRGGFGTVKLGNFDTVYKEYGAVVSTFGISSGHFISTSSVLSSIGLDTEDGLFGDAGFHIRAPNSVMYETPSFGGFQAGIQYSPDEAKGNPPGTSGIDANLWSMGVKYEAGPLYASVQYERHNDWFEGSLNSAVPSSGANPNSKDTGVRLSARYNLTPAHRLMADISRLEWKEDGQGAAGEFSSYKKVTWDIGWEARWGGPWRTNLTYARANDGDCSLSGGVACSTSGLKATQWNAVAAYDLSKRTFIYGALSRVSMGDSARFDNWTNGTPPRGADVTQWALGITHSF